MTLETAKQTHVEDNASGPANRTRQQVIADLKSAVTKMGGRHFTAGEVDPHAKGLRTIVAGLKGSTVAALAGRPGIGKSQACATIASMCAIGRDHLGLFVDYSGNRLHVAQGDVVILALEDPHEEMERRWAQYLSHLEAAVRSHRQFIIGDNESVLSLEEFEMIKSRVHVICLAGSMTQLIGRNKDGSPVPTEQMTALETKIAELRPILIIFDTFRRAKGPFSELDEQHVTGIISVFEGTARKSGALVLFVHHTTKSSEESEDSMYAAGGSTALAGSVRGMITLRQIYDLNGELIEGECALVSAKNNYDRGFATAYVKPEGGYLSACLYRSSAFLSRDAHKRWEKSGKENFYEGVQERRHKNGSKNLGTEPQLDRKKPKPVEYVR